MNTQKEISVYFQKVVNNDFSNLIKIIRKKALKKREFGVLFLYDSKKGEAVNNSNIDNRKIVLFINKVSSLAVKKIKEGRKY